MDCNESYLLHRVRDWDRCYYCSWSHSEREHSSRRIHVKRHRRLPRQIHVHFVHLWFRQWVLAAASLVHHFRPLMKTNLLCSCFFPSDSITYLGESPTLHYNFQMNTGMKFKSCVLFLKQFIVRHGLWSLWRSQQIEWGIHFPDHVRIPGSIFWCHLFMIVGRVLACLQCSLRYCDIRRCRLPHQQVLSPQGRKGNLPQRWILGIHSWSREGALRCCCTGMTPFFFLQDGAMFIKGKITGRSSSYQQIWIPETQLSVQQAKSLIQERSHWKISKSSEQLQIH